MGKYGKWIILALSLSLMANAFAAGHYVARGPGPDRQDTEKTISAALPRGTFRALPDTARRAFRDTILAERRQNLTLRRDIRETRARLAKLATQAGPLDQDAMRETFEQLRRLQATKQESFENALLAALNAMSEEERKRFAERALTAPEKRPPSPRERFMQNRELRRSSGN